MQTLFQSSKAYRLIKTEYRASKLSHAYLILLDDARNLRFALKTFAKIFFLGDNADSDEIGGKPSAKRTRVENLIDAESFSDCLIFPAEKDKKLKVEDAEKILEESVLTPVEGDKKLFLIENFSEANVQTQNKLLKLLEEPPEGVYFLLGATSSYSVLTTVLSRVKKLEINDFTPSALTDALRRIYGDKYEQSALSLCAAASGGNLGKAQNMLEGGYYENLLSSAFKLCLCATHEFPSAVKQISETKRQKEFLSVLRLIFRDALALKTQGNTTKNLLLQAEKPSLHEVANRYTTRALLFAQEAISAAEKQIFTNANFGQCVELCLAKIKKENE